MPIGYIRMLEPITEAFRSIQPKSVLDIGIGYGLNGALLRNYYHGRADGHLRRPFSWRLDGIEVFPHYRNPMWELYDDVYIADVAACLDVVDSYDLVVFTDVIEHLPAGVGREILERSKHAIVGVCRDMSLNGGDPNGVGVYGNKGENHVTLWEPRDVESLGYKVTVLNPVYFMATR